MNRIDFKTSQFSTNIPRILHYAFSTVLLASLFFLVLFTLTYWLIVNYNVEIILTIQRAFSAIISWKGHEETGSDSYQFNEKILKKGGRDPATIPRGSEETIGNTHNRKITHAPVDWTHPALWRWKLSSSKCWWRAVADPGRCKRSGYRRTGRPWALTSTWTTAPWWSGCAYETP